ncbi:MarR family winged helix-turn-helix transcriptional regulator [Streptomyces catenulae]|uniref:MarR family transcriptional regulator n=1 Tax=Streptomyces catenulae TaxID=66875 RepID=A0ABV2YZR6_9ACTN|nr:MarR family transcriptional regulator [Streptomyces catenulae]
MDLAALAMDLDFAMRLLRGRIRAESGVEAEGLSRPQLTALYRVVREGPITTSELAALEYMRPQSMAQTLTGLEEAGLIRRTPDEHDGRRILLSGTERGSELVTDLLGLHARWLSAAIADELSPDEQEQLASAVKLMGRLVDSTVGPVVSMRRRGVHGGAR